MAAENPGDNLTREQSCRGLSDSNSGSKVLIFGLFDPKLREAAIPGATDEFRS